METKENNVSIKVTDKGPLIVKGTFKLQMKDGKIVEHNKVTALCRCGKSKNKPYCDGSHEKTDFDD